MIIKKNTDVNEISLEEQDINKVKRKILIGPDDGSVNIIMRDFTILPGGNTAFHSHEHEHVIKIENGRGIVINGKGNEFQVTEGQSIFIKGDEKHQFKNPFSEPFEFLCIIRNIEKK